MRATSRLAMSRAVRHHDGTAAALAARFDRRDSMRLSIFAAVTSATMLLSAQCASAKTLVYCSEGSPENFYPAINTTGTTFDASARQIYNRLLEFKRGSTEVEPGLAESYDIAPDGKSVTFHLQGRQVADHQVVHADPRLQRRRRGLQLPAPVGQGEPLVQGDERPARVL